MWYAVMIQQQSMPVPVVVRYLSDSFAFRAVVSFEASPAVAYGPAPE